MGGTHVTFKNPEDVWIQGLRWRELILKKDNLKEITDAGFLEPTTREDCHVPP